MISVLFSKMGHTGNVSCPKCYGYFVRDVSPIHSKSDNHEMVCESCDVLFSFAKELFCYVCRSKVSCSNVPMNTFCPYCDSFLPSNSVKEKKLILQR